MPCVASPRQIHMSAAEGAWEELWGSRKLLSLSFAFVNPSHEFSFLSLPSKRVLKARFGRRPEEFSTPWEMMLFAQTEVIWVGGRDSTCRGISTFLLL